MSDNGVIRKLQPHLKDYLSFLGIKLRSNMFSCVLHEDKNPSCGIYRNGIYWMCQSCGKYGDIVELCMVSEGKSFGEAIIYLAGKFGIPLKDTGFKITPQIDKDPALEALNKASDMLRDHQNSKYMIERKISINEAKTNVIGTIDKNKLVKKLHTAGYNNDILVKAGIGNYTDKNEFWVSPAFGKNSLTFALKDIHGQTIGFAGRDMHFVKGVSKAKYISTRSTDYYVKKNYLYNMNSATYEASRSESIWLVEGYMDVLALKRIGIRNVMGICGTSFTEGHYQLLKDTKITRVNYCMDSDRAGITSMLKYIEKYFTTDDIRVVITMLPKGKDPDEIIKDMGKEFFRTLVPLSKVEFILRYSNDLENLTEEETIVKRCGIACKHINDMISLHTCARFIAEEHGIMSNTILRRLIQDGRIEKIFRDGNQLNQGTISES